jgi:hypothetical protein
MVAAGRPKEALAICRFPDCTLAHLALGNAAEVQEALDTMIADPRGDRPFNIATVYAVGGDPDKAFEWLERSRQEHLRVLNGIKSDLDLRSLHSDPRWAELLRKMNLPVD